MDLLPAIDLREGKCVRLLQGDYARQIDYADDPVAQAQAFEQAGARWLHVVDLDGARQGSPRHQPVIERITRQTRLNLQVGGGIRTADQADQLFAAGVRRVVMGTRALEDLAWFESLVRSPAFAGRIVLGLDARQGRLATRGWTQTAARTVDDLARLVNDWPLAAIVYTDIIRDGMLAGPNVEATARLARTCRTPIIASGGVSTLADVEKLAVLPLAGIIVGRALYEGALDLSAALSLLARATPMDQ